MPTTLVLPIIHMNGTSFESLIEERQQFASAVRKAMDTLSEMWPNQRDYYPVDGLWQQACEQANRRMATLTALYHELLLEIVSLQPSCSGFVLVFRTAPCLAIIAAPVYS